jgi:hypothetical protein
VQSLLEHVGDVERIYGLDFLGEHLAYITGFSTLKSALNS